jgi:hypothetical protein
VTVEYEVIDPAIFDLPRCTGWLDGQPTFTRRRDGRTLTDSVVIDGEFPEQMDIRLSLLDGRLLPSLWREGLRVYFRLANGEAEYVLTHYDLDRDTVRGAALYRKTWEVNGAR